MQTHSNSRLTACFALLLLSIQLSGQATLPLSRTTWDVAPTGWTDTGTGIYTTTFACTGSNMGQLNSTGDNYLVFFSGVPGTMVIKLKKASMSGESFVTVEESPNNSSWTSLGVYGTCAACTAITDCGDISFSLNGSSRYVRWTYTKATGNLGLDDVSITGTTPIELVSFAAQKETDQTRLLWNTATERNNDYFSIERSSDGIHYEEIGTVKGAGDSNTPQSYTYIDDRPLPGKNYYRLRQVDFDGKFSYSPVVSARFGGLGNFSMTPVSSHDQWQVQLDEPASENGVWQLLDMDGRLINSATIDAESTDFQIDTQELPAGIYVLKLIIGRQTMAGQFWKN